jgi:hypothetical protein
VSRSPSCEQALVDERRRVDRPRREQLEAVVVDDDRERVGQVLREPPGEQAAEADVGVPARERIEEEVLPSRDSSRSIRSVFGVGMRERCICVSSIGRAASISGSKKSPWAASASTSSTESASSLESGILAPAQAIMNAFLPSARRTYAVISSARTNSSVRPAKTKQSPFLRRATKPSSTTPMRPPERYFTCIDESLTMVPTLSLWRRAIARLGTR